MAWAVAVLERASKGAVSASTALVVALLLATHPDLTVPLQAAGAAAGLGGWLLAGRRPDAALACFTALAPIAPALLHQLTGREGPVLDLIWLAGLAAALLRESPWTRWRLPPTWRVLLGGWALSLALVWPVLLGRETGFNPLGLSDLNAINAASGLSAPYAASWLLTVALTALVGLLWLDRLMAQPGRGAGTVPAVRALWIGGTLASLVAIYQGAVDITALSTPAWGSLRRATGTLLDANAYGAMAAIAGPMALAALWAPAPAWRRPAALAILAVNWAGVWMSGSRTALVCAVIGALGVAAWLVRGSDRRPSPRLLAGFAIIAVALAGLVLASDAVGPLARLRETPVTRAGLRSLWDRGGYGVIALQMLRDHPWTGVGLGTYHVLASDYWRRISDLALPFDNAQNWWRHQLAEMGVLGTLPLFAWSLALAAGALRRGAPDAPSARPIARMLLAGLGLSSLLGVPTQNPVVLLWFGVLCAASVYGPDVSREPRPAWTGPAALAGLVLALGLAGGHAVLARGDLSVATRAVRANRDFVVGASAPEPIPDLDQYRWTGRRARFVLVRQGAWLMARVWVAHPDVDRRPVHVTLKTPCQVLLDQTFATTAPETMALALPDGGAAVDVSVTVSRTWQPTAYGSDDRRHLGAGVALDFRPDQSAIPVGTRTVQVQACS